MKKKQFLDDMTTTKGLWWLPSNPEKRLQGEITFGPVSGAKLNLFGHFYDAFDDKKLTRRIVIHGTTFESKHITLFDSVIESSKLHIPGGRSCSVSSYSGIVGGHFETRKEIAFRKVTANLSGLKDWVWTSGISMEMKSDPHSLKIEYEVPKTIQMGHFGEIAMSLEFHGHAQPGFNSFSIDEDCVLVLETAKMTPYEDFEDLVQNFQRFLCLATQRPVYAKTICGHTDAPVQNIEGTEIFRDHILLRKLGLEGWEDEALIPHKMLFSFPELQTPMQELIPRFCEITEKLKTSVDLFFSTVYHPGQSARMRFITLAQAIEGFHRATSVDKYVSDDEYRAVREALVAAIPSNLDSGFRVSLENRLGFLHEFSLMKRVKDLASRHSELLSQFLGSPSKFAKQISEARNSLTHAVENSRSVSDDYKELYHLSDKLYLLFEICYLAESGILAELPKESFLSRNRCVVKLHYGPV